jgi:predicted amino acid-binding ACT domain protein
LSPATGVAALRVEGIDRPGLGAKITGAIADAGINLRGLSAAVLSRFVDYMAFDSAEDAEKAAKAIKAATATKVPGKKSSKR